MHISLRLQVAVRGSDNSPGIVLIGAERSVTFLLGLQLALLAADDFARWFEFDVTISVAVELLFLAVISNDIVQHAITCMSSVIHLLSCLHHRGIQPFLNCLSSLCPPGSQDLGSEDCIQISAKYESHLFVTEARTHLSVPSTFEKVLTQA